MSRQDRCTALYSRDRNKNWEPTRGRACRCQMSQRASSFHSHWKEPSVCVEPEPAADIDGVRRRTVVRHGVWRRRAWRHGWMCTRDENRADRKSPTVCPIHSGHTPILTAKDCWRSTGRRQLALPRRYAHYLDHAVHGSPPVNPISFSHAAQSPRGVILIVSYEIVRRFKASPAITRGVMSRRSAIASCDVCSRR